MRWLLRLSVCLFATVLVAVAGPLSGAVVPGDDGLIAFSLHGWDRIATIRADGSDLTALLAGRGNVDSAPAWSPDGTRIAFVRYSRSTLDTDLWVMDPDGSHRSRLTSGPRRDFNPAWSPDGTSIVFVRVGPNGGRHLRVKVLDGSRSVLLPVAGSSFYPDWSPDGSLIVFNKLGGNLFTIRPDGSDVTKLTATPDLAEITPAWSPDGTQVVFMGYFPDQPGDLYRLRLADGEIRNLTETPAVAERSPAWAPSGTRIVFESHRALWIMDADGGNLAQVPNAVGRDPDWQPVGTSP